jgi:minor histocompatibility antigen H13
VKFLSRAVAMQWNYDAIAAPRGHLLLLLLTVLPTVVYIPYEVSIVLHAALVVYVSSWRSIREEPHEEHMSDKDAMRFPIMGSCVLLGLFLCLKFLPKDLINLLIAGYITFLGAFAIIATLEPLLSRLLPESLARTHIHLPTIPKIPFILPEPLEWHPNILELILLAPALALGVWYLRTKHWLANNILGICFSIAGIETFPLGSVRVSSILLAGLFLYDIFWVFCTPVMVGVAKDLEAPIKLMFRRGPWDPATPRNFAILGLGDIVIPGLVVALMCRYDLEHNFKTRYFQTVFWGYVGGVTTTIVVMNVFKAAQPGEPGNSSTRGSGWPRAAAAAAATVAVVAQQQLVATGSSSW